MSNEFWKEQFTYVTTLQKHLAKRRELIVLGALNLLILVALAIWPLPQWMVRREYWEWKQHPNEYAKLVDDYRKTIVQIIGGAFLLYTLAIMTVIGRRKSKQDRGSLTLFRTDLPWLDLSRANLAKADLSASDLNNANLTEANLEGADLMGASLSRALLHKTNLTEARLSGAQAQAAHLVKANLQRADLMSANLSGAQLLGANLTDAIFIAAQLQKANFSGAQMQGAYLLEAQLQGANLSKAALSQEQLDGADGDHTTKLPPGLTHPNKWPQLPNETEFTANEGPVLN